MKSIEKFLQTNTRRVVMPNGLTLVFLPDDRTELAAVQVWVKTGSIHEDKFLGAGISHFVEHMVFKGTGKRNYLEIFAEAQANGASMNAYTSFDRTIFTFDGAAESCELGVDILSDMMFNATFPINEFLKERDVILREISMYDDDPDDQLNQKMFEMAFRHHPYRYPIIGIKSIFENLTRDDLFEYWQERYVPNNMTLVIVGPFSSDWVKAIADKYFGQVLPKSLKPTYIPQEPFQLADREQRIYGQYNLSRGAITFKIPGVGHKDSAALQVLSNTLGSGYSAVLYQRLREELKLVHDIDAATWMADGQGLFWIQYTCDADKRAEVEEVILSNISKIAEQGICSDRVKKALNQAIVSELDSRKTVAGQAHHLGWAEVCLGDLKYPQKYIESLKTINSSSVKRLVKKYFKPNTCTKVSIEPESEKRSDITKIFRKTKNKSFNLFTLNNGTRLLIQHNPNFPKTHIQAISSGGGLYEDKNLRGVSHLLSTLLVKDTKKNSAVSIVETIENAGGYFSNFCGNNYFGLSMELLQDDTDIGIELMKNALSCPSFNDSVFEHEKHEQIAIIREAMDDIFNIGIRQMRKQFFGNHPYSIHHIGSEETVSNISKENLINHYNKVVVGPNVVITAISPLEPEKLKDAFLDLETLLPHREFQMSQDSFEIKSESKNTLMLDKEQSMAFKAFPIGGIQTPDFYAAEYLEELFNGLSSNFVVEVREKLGLAYSIGAARILGLKQGMFCLFAGTQEQYLDRVNEEMNRAINRFLTKSVKKSEFENCKNCLKVRHRSKLQNISKRAYYAGACALFGLPIDELNHYEDRIDAITLDTLLERSSLYLTQEKSSTLFISSSKYSTQQE